MPKIEFSADFEIQEKSPRRIVFTPIWVILSMPLFRQAHLLKMGSDLPDGFQHMVGQEQKFETFRISVRDLRFEQQFEFRIRTFEVDFKSRFGTAWGPCSEPGSNPDLRLAGDEVRRHRVPGQAGGPRHHDGGVQHDPLPHVVRPALRGIG